MFYVYADGESIFSPLDSSLAIYSPKVTLELGKSGSFQFNIPKSNEYYNQLEQLKTSIVVELDNAEIFRGRVLSITRGFSNTKTVYCEGILSFLVDSVQRARRYNGKASQLYKDILRRHNNMVESSKRFSIELGSYGVEDATVVIPGKKEDDDAYFGESKYEQAIIESIVDEWQTTFDYINTIFIEYLGGYLIAKHDAETGYNYIDYISNDALDSKIESARSEDKADHEIEFGVNMIDFSEEINAEELFTVLVPLGDGDDKELTIASATNKYSDNTIELVEVDGKQIGIADRVAKEKYGSIIKTHVFDNVNKANTLFTDGVRYLKLHKNMPTTYSIRAIDLHFINRTSGQIEIGDTVKIVSSIHGMYQYMLCTRIEYDLENPGNTIYTFGNPEQTLTDRYRRDKNKDKSDKDHDQKRAAKGGGGAAGAAKDDAVDEAQGIVNDLYDAYIKVDDAAGTITMATLYHDIVNGKANLKAMSGIDLDSGPDAAKVNIYTMYDDIGKANTAIKETSDSLHAEISAVSTYAKGVNTALATFVQNVSDTYATQEMLVAAKTEYSSAMAGFKEEVSSTYATIQAFTEYKNTESQARAEIKAWASEEFAKFLTKTEYETRASAAKTSIEQWADGKFASITALTTYKTDTDSNLATIKATADANTSSITAATATLSTQGTSIASLTLLTNKLESVMKLTTNYNDLTWDKEGKQVTGTVSAAGIKISSDALKAAIENTTDFASYIDGKLVNSTTSVKQIADDAKSMIELVANFKGSGAKIKLESFKDALTNHIKNQISLEAESIKIAAETFAVNAVFTAEGTATFTRGVSCNSVLYANGNFTTNANATFEKGYHAKADCKIWGNLNLRASDDIKIGTASVALKTDLGSYLLASSFTARGVANLFTGGKITWQQYLRDTIKSNSATNFNEYIKAIINETYIKSIISGTYVQSNITASYMKETLSGNKTWGAYLRYNIGCVENGEPVTLSSYISKHQAREHTHTISAGHYHVYKDANGNDVYTGGASKYQFTTSSNS